MPDSHKCERLGGVFFVWPRPPMQDDPSPSRRRDAAQHQPPTTVSPPTTTRLKEGFRILVSIGPSLTGQLRNPRETVADRVSMEKKKKVRKTIITRTKGTHDASGNPTTPGGVVGLATPDAATKLRQHRTLNDLTRAGTKRPQIIQMAK
ncbi:hypothetical protein ABEB36_015541 [Hypothenemus hampei]|uniref:Uncharacterized protein n=1 Tax=Hypothenemus hampei TaxID=57062 RepID=A0ABD1E0B7_HYPHA